MPLGRQTYVGAPTAADTYSMSHPGVVTSTGVNRFAPGAPKQTYDRVRTPQEALRRKWSRGAESKAAHPTTMSRRRRFLSRLAGAAMGYFSMRTMGATRAFNVGSPGQRFGVSVGISIGGALLSLTGIAHDVPYLEGLGIGISTGAMHIRGEAAVDIAEQAGVEGARGALGAFGPMVEPTAHSAAAPVRASIGGIMGKWIQGGRIIPDQSLMGLLPYGLLAAYGTYKAVEYFAELEG